MRFYHVFFIIGLMLISLAACSGDAEDQGDTQPETAPNASLTEAATAPASAAATEVATEAATQIPTAFGTEISTEAATETATEAAPSRWGSSANNSPNPAQDPNEAATESVSEPINISFDTEGELDTELLEQGIAIYRAQYCGSCHELAAANTRGTFGPSHNAAAIQAAVWIASDNYRGEAQTIEQYLYESIANPTIYFTPTYEGSNHRMPDYSLVLEYEEIRALVYLLSQQDGN